MIASNKLFHIDKVGILRYSTINCTFANNLTIQCYSYICQIFAPYRTNVIALRRGAILYFLRGTPRFLARFVVEVSGVVIEALDICRVKQIKR